MAHSNECDICLMQQKALYHRRDTELSVFLVENILIDEISSGRKFPFLRSSLCHCQRELKKSVCLCIQERHWVVSI